MTEFLQNIPVWGVAATLGAFALGTWLNKKTGQAIFNPLLLGSIFIILSKDFFHPQAFLP